MSTGERLTQAIQAVLPRSMSVVEGMQTNDVYHLEIQAAVPNMPSASIRHTVNALWVGEGWPKQVESVLRHGSLPDVIVGRRISPGAREFATSHNVGWVEESGAAEFITSSGLVIRTEPKVQHAGDFHMQTRLQGEGKQVAHKWTAAMLATAEALLLGTRATVDGVKNATTLSTGSCVRALRALTDLQLLSATAARGRYSQRNIENMSAFLGAYRDAAREQRAALPASFTHVVWKHPLDHIVKMSELWDRAGISWAVTGALGADQIAPYLTDVSTVEIYVGGPSTAHELDTVAGLIGGAPSLARGARLVLRPFPTTTSALHITRHCGLAIVPLPRLYADLFDVGVRGGEAAEHLKEVTGLGRDS